MMHNDTAIYNILKGMKKIIHLHNNNDKNDDNNSGYNNDNNNDDNSDLKKQMIWYVLIFFPLIWIHINILKFS